MSQLRIRLPAKKTNFSAAMESLVRHQNLFFDKKVYINIDEETSKLDTIFDVDVDLHKANYSDLNILLLNDNPYEKSQDDKFSNWILNASEIHNCISRYRRIVATSLVAYQALVFKHSQKIVYQELPFSVKFMIERFKNKVVDDEYLVFVVDDHEIYRKKKKKLELNGDLRIILLREVGITEEDYLIILKAKSLYWMSNKSILYNGIRLDPEILSLLGFSVNVSDRCGWKSLIGKKFSDILSKSEVRKEFVNYSSEYLRDNNENLVFNFLASINS